VDTSRLVEPSCAALVGGIAAGSVVLDLLATAVTARLACAPRRVEAMPRPH
jgi:hypothetical protein